MRRLFIVFPLLLNACAGTPVQARDPAQDARAKPVAVVAEYRVAQVFFPESLTDVSSPSPRETGARTAVHDAAAKLEIAPAVRTHVLDTLKRFSRIQLAPPDKAASRVIVEAAQVGFERARYLENGRALVVTLQARWLKDGQELRSHLFSHRSGERRVDQWDASTTAAALTAAYVELGERLAEEWFMPAGLPHAVGSACGLQWVAPRRLYRPQMGPAPWDWNRFTALDTTTPTLVWESFADHARRAGAEAVSNTAREVRYDLRVWQAPSGTAPLLVYERHGLATTEHTVEMPLRAATKYFWSVRARFIAPDGSTRVTTWARFRLPYAAAHAGEEAEGAARDPCLLDFIAEPNYYRFATPAAK